MGRFPDPHTLVYRIVAAITRLDIDLVLDVGAHHGGFAQMLRTEGRYGGDIVSFEPFSASRAELARVAGGDGRWRVEPYALADRDGTASLHLFEGREEFNSLGTLNEAGRTRFGLVSDTEEVVSVRKLSTLVETLRLRPRLGATLLKTDTQGHDLSVIEGALPDVTEIPLVLMELASLPIYDDVPRMETVIARMRTLGFDPVTLFPVAWAQDRLRVLEFDCLFANREIATARLTP